MGNNAQWSYDPTILAALIYAGRLISYQEQKRELLEALQVLVKEVDGTWAELSMR